jgi:hypothetical protein
MKYALFVLLSSLLFFISCKKNDEPAAEMPLAIPLNYANLEIGNYWIYQQFDLDADGNYTALNVYDSLYVEKDTLIDAITYFKYWTDQIQGGSLYPIYLRDSVGFTVLLDGLDGHIFFATTSAVDTVETFCYLNAVDTVYCTYAIGSPNDVSVNVPAGEFVCRDLTTYYEISSFTSGLSDKVRHRYMAKDVGMVYETLLPIAGGTNYRVRKLMSYGKNE